jgi:hypothetical protein
MPSATGTRDVSAKSDSECDFTRSLDATDAFDLDIDLRSATRFLFAWGNGTFQQHKPGDKVKASIELKGYDDAMTLSYAVALAHGGTMVVCWGLLYPG